MKEGLKRVWNDIVRKKKYIDVYAALTWCVVLFFLEVFLKVDQTIVLSGLLFILSIFAKSIIDIHWNNENMVTAISKLGDTRSLASRLFHRKDNLVEIEQIMSRATKICLWGYTLKTHIPYLENVIRKKAEEGRENKILLLKPSGEAIRMAEMRMGKPNAESSVKKLEGTLETNIKTLEGIKNDYPNGKFEYKVIDFLAPYTMYIYDDNLPQGSLMVRLSEFEAKDDDRTTYYLTSKDEKDLFESHVKQFTTAWKLGELQKSYTNVSQSK